MNLYIYYRVEIKHAAAVEASVRALQEDLRGHCRASEAPPNAGNPVRPTALATVPVRAVLVDRPLRMRCGLQQCLGSGSSHQTWMEVYLDVPAGFEALLEAAWARSTMPLMIDGDRHTECFLDCLPCA